MNSNLNITLKTRDASIRILEKIRSFLKLLLIRILLFSLRTLYSIATTVVCNRQFDNNFNRVGSASSIASNDSTI